MSGERKFDEAVRRWALERARDHGLVYTAEVATRFGITTESAAKRLAFLRSRGHLIAGEALEHFRFGNEITDAGLAYLGTGPTHARRWDCKPLCMALREGMRL
jgi:hypothetical protein